MANVLGRIFGRVSSSFRTGGGGMTDILAGVLGGMASVFGRGLRRVSRVFRPGFRRMTYVFAGVFGGVAGVLHVLLGGVLSNSDTNR